MLAIATETVEHLPWPHAQSDHRNRVLDGKIITVMRLMTVLPSRAARVNSFHASPGDSTSCTCRLGHTCSRNSDATLIAPGKGMQMVRGDSHTLVVPSLASR